MKTTYQKPEMTVVAVKTHKMFCQSLGKSSNKVSDNNAVLGRRGTDWDDWDDDDEY